MDQTICDGCKYKFSEEELVDGLCEDCRVQEIRDRRRKLRRD